MRLYHNSSLNYKRVTVNEEKPPIKNGERSLMDEKSSTSNLMTLQTALNSDPIPFILPC